MRTPPLAARRLALQLIAVASLIAGGATLWTILDPVSVRSTETWILLSVLGLFILPVGTLVAFEADRRARARAARFAEHAHSTRTLSDDSAILSLDIEAGLAHAETDAAPLEAATRRHGGRKMVSARRPARSAPGRSRAPSRR